MPLDADRRLARIARRQHGTFTRQQAVEAGVPPQTITWRARHGIYQRLQPTVYALNGVPDSRKARMLAALLAAGKEAVLSHLSAAFLHRLDDQPPPPRIHLLTLGRRLTGLLGVTVHRTQYLPAHHVTVVDGIPVTTAPRTLCDLPSMVEHPALRRAIADALRRGLATAGALQAALDELGPVRGARMLRAVLGELSTHEARAKSEMESIYLRLNRRAALPEPVVNHPVRDVYGRLRYLDVAYIEERLPVELDSRRFHGLVLDRRDDNKRQNALVLANWHRPLRFTYFDLSEEPDRVIYEVTLALDQARRAADGSSPPARRGGGGLSPPAADGSSPPPPRAPSGSR